MRTYQQLTTIALVLLALMGLTDRARAHEPQPIWFELKLEEGRLLCKLRVLSPLVSQWLKIDRPDFKSLTDEDMVLIHEKLQIYFKEHPFFQADGIIVEPVIGEMELTIVETHDLIKLHYLKVDMEFPVAAAPKSMTFSWDGWDIFDTWPVYRLGAFLAWDNEEISIIFDDGEPAFTWHATPKRPPERVLPPPPEPPRGLEVPVISLALGIGVIFFIALSFLLRLDWRLRLAVSGVLLLAAVSTLGLAHREIDPPWRDTIEPIKSEEAIEIFEALHHNTYNAFRFEDESQIYDTLARSVEGGLLERLYDEVHESLILREEGGVVGRVSKVEIVEEKLQLPDDPNRREFEVDATWIVQGRVGHYGHFHIRANRYQAHFLLRELAVGWRILDVQVTNQERIEPEDDPALDGSGAESESDE